jgi:acetyl esterase
MSELHPEMRKQIAAIEQALRDAGLSDFHSGGVEPARRLLHSLATPVESRPPIYEVSEGVAPAPAGPVSVRIYRPDDRPNLPVLVWFHGGGWVLGNLETADHNCRRLANDVGCLVVSVDYRRAPETPFPGAIDDCWADTAWVAASSGELGADPRRIAVAGDSAGGNLAACVAYQARAHGLSLALQLLVYPVIDADFERSSYVENAEGYGLTYGSMRWYWDCYVPEAGLRSDPRVSPIHATDLSGLAPALILTAEYDPLRDEGEAYAAALAAAGVPVELRRYDGTIHGFFNSITELPVPEVDAASKDAAAALRRAFGAA